MQRVDKGLLNCSGKYIDAINYWTEGARAQVMLADHDTVDNARAKETKIVLAVLKSRVQRLFGHTFKIEHKDTVKLGGNSCVCSDYKSKISLTC